MVLQDLAGHVDGLLLHLLPEGLVGVLFLLVDLQVLEERLDVAVDLAVLHGGLREHGELAGGHVELGGGPQQVVHLRQIHVLDAGVQIEVGPVILRAHGDRDRRLSGPLQAARDLHGAQALGFLVGEVLQADVGVGHEDAVVRRGLLVDEAHRGAVHEDPARLQQQVGLVAGLLGGLGGGLGGALHRLGGLRAIRVVAAQAVDPHLFEIDHGHRRRVLHVAAAAEGAPLEREPVAGGDRLEVVERDPLQLHVALEAGVGLAQEVGGAGDGQPALVEHDGVDLDR